MKKIFSFVAGALMSVAMMAGQNDLLWDYSEGAPSGSPDSAAAKNGALYFNNKFEDAAGTKNGLKGIKLNSSGYCAFKKAAVAGKLKLSFGPRDGVKLTGVEVWNCTWGADGKTPAKGDVKIATTGKLTEYGTQTIELSAEQTDIYLCRTYEDQVETGLQKIEFKENVARAFVDFKIEFRDNPYTVLLPEGGALPAGVVVAGTSYNGTQHGIFSGSITVPVDGPIKFTIGACQYSGGVITVKKGGVDFTTVSNNAPCGEVKPNYAQNVTYTYLGEADTLTFVIPGNVYIPYFFAEATEVTPCEVIFKDQNGKVLGKVETIEGAHLDEIPYTVDSLPALGEGNVFRGWYYTNGKKAHIGDAINGNTTIHALVTPFETATVGSVQNYPLNVETFYPEDHETIEIAGAAYYHDGQHGWAFKNNDSFTVEVAGNAFVSLAVCQYGTSAATWTAVDASDNILSTLPAIDAADGKEVSLRYSGPATRLTFTLTNSGNENYLHKIAVYNVENFVEKDTVTGYIMVPEGDAAAFILALVQAEEGDKIFLPNGLYDLGETVLTAVNQNNISIIGQSMDGVIIKNAPDYKTESIDKTATIKINKNVSGTYLQDLTIQNALDYYKNNNGRAVALWDQGTKTVCKNVKLLSYQDTYYSNLQKAVKYFEDCEIHGTVDFICGDGSVYFKNNLLYCEKRQKSGGGSDALTASNADALDRGYVFEGCTLKSECPVVSMGRAWNNTPQTAFLNTLVDYSAGQFSFSDESGKIQRWTKELMNAGAWPQFIEYNTHLADGTVLTPASNVVEFIDTKTGNAKQSLETVISAEGAALRTMEYTLGDWAATAAAEATQAEAETTGTYEPEGIYLLEVVLNSKLICTIETGAQMNNEFIHEGVTIRKANARGGFGPKAGGEQGVENVAEEGSKAVKIFRNGQLIIIRDNKEYNVLGAQL